MGSLGVVVALVFVGVFLSVGGLFLGSSDLVHNGVESVLVVSLVFYHPLGSVGFDQGVRSCNKDTIKICTKFENVKVVELLIRIFEGAINIVCFVGFAIISFEIYLGSLNKKN